MSTTYFAKSKDLKRSLYLVDAKGKILGRMATKVASILRGKHKPLYTPNIDSGDSVIVINAKGVKVTGRKLNQKIYRRYSGYPGGLREVVLSDMLKNKPATVVRLAVQRMLPQGPLGRKLIKKLRVYADDKHLHKGSDLIVLEV